MTIAAAVLGSLFFGGFTAGMMYVIWAGVLSAYKGPTWRRRAQGIALVIIIIWVSVACVYALWWMWTTEQQTPVFP